MHTTTHNISNHFDVQTPEKLLEVSKRSNKVIIRFFRPGCPACKNSFDSWMYLTQIPEYKKYMFVSIDTSVCDGLARAFGISQVPTFVIAQKGRPAVSIIGSDLTKLHKAL